MECFLAGMMITSGIVVLGSYTEMLDYAMYIVAKYWESTPFMPLVSCLDVRPRLHVSEADANV